MFGRINCCAILAEFEMEFGFISNATDGLAHLYRLPPRNISLCSATVNADPAIAVADQDKTAIARQPAIADKGNRAIRCRTNVCSARCRNFDPAIDATCTRRAKAFDNRTGDGPVEPAAKVV